SERRVVRGVSNVPEHADLVQPATKPLRGALRDGKRGPGSGNVEVDRVAAQRLQGAGRCVRALDDRRRDVVLHAVMMPRMARPAVKSGATRRATASPSCVLPRTTAAAR